MEYLQTRILTFFILLLSPLLSFNQSIKIENFNVEAGLSNNVVTSIQQDRKGMMWFGTFDGLNRYDGYAYKVYRNNKLDSLSISGNSVTELLVDNEKDCIWVGTSNGLNLFDLRTEEFKRYTKNINDSLSISDNDIRVIFKDRDNNIWIGTRSGGLNLFDPEKGAFKRFMQDETNPNSISSNQISTIDQDSSGNLWIGTIGGGFLHLDPETERFTKIGEANDAKTENIYWFNEYYDDGLIVTGFGGKKKLDIKTKKWVDYQYPDVDYRKRKLTTASKKQTRWIIRNDSAFIETVSQLQQFEILDISRSSFLKNGYLASIYFYFDRNDNWWIGTNGFGAFRLSEHAQKFLPFLPPKYNDILPVSAPLSIQEEQNGNIWIGTSNSGVFRFIPSSQELKKYPFKFDIISNNEITTREEGQGLFDVLIAQDGTVWSGGLYSFYKKNPDSDSFESQYTPNLAESYYLSFFNPMEDKDGNIWMGTRNKGLIKYDTKQRTIKNFQYDQLNVPNLNNFLLIHDSLIDHEGNIWVGTMAGLCFLNPKVDTAFTLYRLNGELLAENHLHRVLLEDSKKNIWVSIPGKGLYRINPKKNTYVFYTEKEGLTMNHAISVKEDEQGIFWICTEKNLLKLNPETLMFQKYDKSDGFILGSSMDASHKSINTGKMYFGLNRFSPKDIKQNPYTPVPSITDLSIYNRKNQGKQIEIKGISHQDNITLAHNDNILNFTFSAFNYANPEASIYSYNLEGFTENWIEVGTTRKVTFTNLNPGRYTLKVKAANEDNIWNVEPTKLDINITPPWYWSWWSKTIYILLTVGMIYWIYRFQLDRKLVENEIMRQKEINHLRNQLYTNITHEFRTPLTVIQGMNAQINTGQHQKETRLIQRNSQNLLNLVNQLLDLTKIESGQAQIHLQQSDIVAYSKYILESFHSLAAQKKINLEFEASPSEIWMDYDAEKMQQILSNLLSNAIKFTSENGKIQLSVEQINKTLSIKLTDNGIGIEASEIPHIFDRFYQVDDSNTRSQMGSGVGLALTKELIQLLGGDILVESKVEKGTSFTISLAITNDAPIVEHNIAIEAQVAVSALQIEKQVTATNVLATNTAPLILLVEDNEDVLTYIIDCLDDNYRILTALNGEQGLKTAIERVPDLIISDVMMPVMDGYTLCQKVQEQEQTNHIPTILLTAKADQESKLEGLAKGAVAYLAKPFDKTELRIRIEQTLARQKRLQVHYSQQVISEARPSDPFLAKVTALIEQDMTKIFNIDELSKALAMSSTQVYRKIKALTGKSTSIFVRHIRLKHAHHLLRTTDLSISEIAYRVGFKDPATFSRYFTEVFGIPPSKLKP